jgi:MoaA/NifB/PqqE/SkfB family radical SAM enzyme
MGVKPKFVFSGGDPLLHPEFIRFCEYLKKHKMKFSILGNPYHLTNDLIIKLKKLGLTEYQMSIDGLKETHDYFRKKGSFDITIKKFRLLKKHNIITKCMFTLSKKNMKELVPVMKFISGKVDYFSFARMVPIGNGINLKSELITPKSYKNY